MINQHEHGYYVKTKDGDERVSMYLGGWVRQLPMTTIDMNYAMVSTDLSTAQQMAKKLDELRKLAFPDTYQESIWTVVPAAVLYHEEDNDESDITNMD